MVIYRTHRDAYRLRRPEADAPSTLPASYSFWAHRADVANPGEGVLFLYPRRPPRPDPAAGSMRYIDRIYRRPRLSESPEVSRRNWYGRRTRAVEFRARRPRRSRSGVAAENRGDQRARFAKIDIRHFPAVGAKMRIRPLGELLSSLAAGVCAPRLDSSQKRNGASRLVDTALFPPRALYVESGD